MMKDPDSIQMNVDRHRKMLSLRQDNKTRVRIEQALGKAKRHLARAIDMTHL